MKSLLSFWPEGQMSLQELMRALSRALDNPKAGQRGHRKSMEGLEATAVDEGLTAARIGATAAATEQAADGTFNAPSAAPAALRTADTGEQQPVAQCDFYP